MKLIIDIPETAYDAYKEWHKNKVATVEQSLIANGIPYEEKPQGEYAEEHIKQAIKENFDIGYEMAKNKYERPKGEWLEPYESHIAQECSICHRQMPAPKWFNFCPNCGADMRGDNK